MRELNESSRIDNTGNLQAPRRSDLFEPDESMYTVKTEEMTEAHHLMLALEEMKRKVKKTEKKLNHAKNKESKLLCLVYNLQSKGIPVNEIYTAEVKDIPTNRFGELAKEEKQKREEEGIEESHESSIMYDFYSDDSFEYIPAGHDFKKTDGKPFKKPAQVPMLNFEELPAYETSSSEGGEDEEDQQQQKEEMYQGGLQFINNFYESRAVMERSPDSTVEQQRSPECRGAPGRNSQSASASETPSALLRPEGLSGSPIEKKYSEEPSKDESAIQLQDI